MPDDDVLLTDLEVIQRYSLAVRGASAARADLITTLQADLEWLRSGRAPKSAGRAGKEAAPVTAAAKPKTGTRTSAASSGKTRGKA